MEVFPRSHELFRGRGAAGLLKAVLPSLQLRHEASGLMKSRGPFRGREAVGLRIAFPNDWFLEQYAMRWVERRWLISAYGGVCTVGIQYRDYRAHLNVPRVGVLY